MKKIFFLAAIAAATVGFTACDKGNENVNPAGDNVVVVKLPDNVTTRVVETPVAGTSVTAVIEDVTVFLLSGDVVAATYEFTSADRTAKEAHIENVPASVNAVIVLANIPSYAADVKSLTSAAAIKSYPYSVASQNGEGTILTQTLMGSTNSLTEKADPIHTGKSYKECTVTLDALTARFEIGGVSAGTGISTVEIVGVWINSFYTDARKDVVQTYASDAEEWKVTPLSLNIGTPATTAFTGYTLPAYTEYPDYHDLGSIEVEASATPAKVYAYQVFAGQNIPHLILLVKGEYLTEQTEGEGDKFFMGYLTYTRFSGEDGDITSVENNTIYKVGLSANGIVVDGGKITPKPELEGYDLGIEVDVRGWTDMHVTPGM